MDALTVIDRYGIPFALLLALALVWRKDLWPFLTTQITVWQTDRANERNAFLAALANIQAAAAAGHAAASDRDHVIAEQIESMAQSVKEIALLTQQNFSALHPATTSARRKRAPVVN